MARTVCPGPAASEEWRARPARPAHRTHLDLGLHLLGPSQLLRLGDGRGEKLGFKGRLGGVGDLLWLALSSDLLCSDLQRERQPRLRARPGCSHAPHPRGTAPRCSSRPPCTPSPGSPVSPPGSPLTARAGVNLYIFCSTWCRDHNIKNMHNFSNPVLRIRRVPKKISHKGRQTCRHNLGTVNLLSSSARRILIPHKGPGRHVWFTKPCPHISEVFSQVTPACGPALGPEPMSLSDSSEAHAMTQAPPVRISVLGSLPDARLRPHTADPQDHSKGLEMTLSGVSFTNCPQQGRRHLPEIGVNVMPTQPMP